MSDQATPSKVEPQKRRLGVSTTIVAVLLILIAVFATVHYLIPTAMAGQAGTAVDGTANELGLVPDVATGEESASIFQVPRAADPTAAELSAIAPVAQSVGAPTQLQEDTFSSGVGPTQDAQFRDRSLTKMLFDVSLQLDEATERYGPGHPEVKKLQRRKNFVTEFMGRQAHANEPAAKLPTPRPSSNEIADSGLTKFEGVRTIRLKLDAALRKYGPNHPQVRALRSRLLQMEAPIDEPLRERFTGMEEYSALKMQLEAARKKHGPNHATVALLQSQIAEYEQPANNQFDPRVVSPNTSEDQFDAEQRRFQAQIDRLKLRVAELERKLQQRAANRDAIIRRRRQPMDLPRKPTMFDNLSGERISEGNVPAQPKPTASQRPHTQLPSQFEQPIPADDIPSPEPGAVPNSIDSIDATRPDPEPGSSNQAVEFNRARTPGPDTTRSGFAPADMPEPEPEPDERFGAEDFLQPLPLREPVDSGDFRPNQKSAEPEPVDSLEPAEEAGVPNPDFENKGLNTIPPPEDKEAGETAFDSFTIEKESLRPTSLSEILCARIKSTEKKAGELRAKPKRSPEEDERLAGLDGEITVLKQQAVQQEKLVKQQIQRTFAAASRMDEALKSLKQAGFADALAEQRVTGKVRSLRSKTESLLSEAKQLVAAFIKTKAINAEGPSFNGVLVFGAAKRTGLTQLKKGISLERLVDDCGPRGNCKVAVVRNGKTVDSRLMSYDDFGKKLVEEVDGSAFGGRAPFAVQSGDIVAVHLSRESDGPIQVLLISPEAAPLMVSVPPGTPLSSVVLYSAPQAIDTRVVAHIHRTAMAQPLELEPSTRTKLMHGDVISLKFKYHEADKLKYSSGLRGYIDMGVTEDPARKPTSGEAISSPGGKQVDTIDYGFDTEPDDGPYGTDDEPTLPKAALKPSASADETGTTAFSENK